MNDNSSAKTPEFRKIMRGYDPAEVSAYIDSLKKELGEALRREKELDEKLSSVMSRYADVQKKSEALDAALADIDREREAVMSDAHRRSAAMLDDTRKRCAEAEREMREGISRQRDAFVSMHEMILSFRADLFERYNAQIDSIDSIASLADAYDEAMMFCMQKNGVTARPTDKTPASEPCARESAMEEPAGEDFEEDSPTEDFAEEEFADEDSPDAFAAEKLTEIADLEVPDHSAPAPAPESFDYFTEDFSTDNMPADNSHTEDFSPEDFSSEGYSAEDFSPEDFSSGGYSAEDFSAEDSPEDDDFIPGTGDGFTAQDYSFDEDNRPKPTAAERILSAETPAVTRDDLPEDFDIYHASGDQLLELIYGKGPAAPADNTDPADDPLRGVDYSFGDD